MRKLFVLLFSVFLFAFPVFATTSYTYKEVIGMLSSRGWNIEGDGYFVSVYHVSTTAASYNHMTDWYVVLRSDAPGLSLVKADDGYLRVRGSIGQLLNYALISGDDSTFANGSWSLSTSFGTNRVSDSDGQFIGIPVVGMSLLVSSFKADTLTELNLHNYFEIRPDGNRVAIKNLSYDHSLMSTLKVTLEGVDLLSSGVELYGEKAPVAMSLMKGFNEYLPNNTGKSTVFVRVLNESGNVLLQSKVVKLNNLTDAQQTDAAKIGVNINLVNPASFYNAFGDWTDRYQFTYNIKFSNVPSWVTKVAYVYRTTNNGVVTSRHLTGVKNILSSDSWFENGFRFVKISDGTATLPDYPSSAVDHTATLASKDAPLDLTVYVYKDDTILYSKKINLVTSAEQVSTVVDPQITKDGFQVTDVTPTQSAAWLETATSDSQSISQGGAWQLPQLSINDIAGGALQTVSIFGQLLALLFGYSPFLTSLGAVFLVFLVVDFMRGR